MARRLQELAGLFSVLINNPHDFPAALHEFVRKFVRNVWDARGGGLFAIGFVIALVWLEARMLFQDLSNFAGFGDYFGEQLIQFLLRFTFESVLNTFQALLWPVFFIQFYGPWGLAVLVAMFAIFPKTLKAPLERWIFGNRDRDNSRADQ